MRKNINYTLPLSEVDKIKICFSKEKGKITKFVIQYFGKFDRRWKTILRIDTCHNFPHMHTYHLQKREIKVKLGENSDINQIFTRTHLKNPIPACRQAGLQNFGFFGCAE